MRLYRDKDFGERREAAAKAKEAALKKFQEKARAAGKATPAAETAPESAPEAAPKTKAKK
jgi:hypothetical protein